MERIAQHTDKGSIIFPLNTDKLLILVCNRKFACRNEFRAYYKKGIDL